MSIELADSRLHPPPSEIAPDRALHYKLHGGDGRIEEGAHPGYEVALCRASSAWLARF
jgi:hypothetical protein